MPQKKATKKKAPSKALVRRSPAQEIAELPQRPPTVEDLMAQAIQKGDVAVMEKLFNMRQVMKGEAMVEAFKSAKTAFLSECPRIVKDKAVKNRDGGHRYSYSPLDRITKIADPVLSRHGFSYDFDSRLEEKGDKLFEVVSCTLHHQAGHSETRDYWSPIDPSALTDSRMNVSQQYGAALQYAKRGAFCNVTGIVVVGEDTDGITPEEARRRQQQQNARPPVSQPKETPTARREAEAKTNGAPAVEKIQIFPAADGEPTIEASTVKTIAKKLENGAIALGDFKKRFPAFKDLDKPLESIRRQDVNPVINWIVDPTGK